MWGGGGGKEGGVGWGGVESVESVKWMVEWTDDCSNISATNFEPSNGPCRLRRRNQQQGHHDQTSFCTLL